MQTEEQANCEATVLSAMVDGSHVTTRTSTENKSEIKTRRNERDKIENRIEEKRERRNEGHATVHEQLLLPWRTSPFSQTLPIPTHMIPIPTHHFGKIPPPGTSKISASEPAQAPPSPLPCL